MTLDRRHVALIAEYDALMNEERTLWARISVQMQEVAAGDGPAQVDLQRWHDVRARRAILDRAILALAEPRESAWGELVGGLE